jgi:Carbohydrate-selective porin, OprB family
LDGPDGHFLGKRLLSGESVSGEWEGRFQSFSRDSRGLSLDSSEVGLEAFDNIAVTNWLYVTPDIQVIEPAGSRSDTAFITGVRVQTRFEGKSPEPATPTPPAAVSAEAGSTALLARSWR